MLATDDVEPFAPGTRIGGLSPFPVEPTWSTTRTTPSGIGDISPLGYETRSDPSFGLKPVAQFDGSGNLVSQFVYGAKGTVPDYILQGGGTYRVVSDHLGSPRLVVNAATGAVAEQLSFDEFGNVTNDTNPGFQPFGFAGGLLDGDTGLVRFGARDFDPRVGRWTAKDPLGLMAGVNVYVYGNGDPVNYIDPSGRSAAIAVQWIEEAAATAGEFIAPALGPLTTTITLPLDLIPLWLWPSTTAANDELTGPNAQPGALGAQAGTYIPGVPDFTIPQADPDREPAQCPASGGGPPSDLCRNIPRQNTSVQCAYQCSGGTEMVPRSDLGVGKIDPCPKTAGRIPGGPWRPGSIW